MKTKLEELKAECVRLYKLCDETEWSIKFELLKRAYLDKYILTDEEGAIEENKAWKYFCQNEPHPPIFYKHKKMYEAYEAEKARVATVYCVNLPPRTGGIIE